MITPSNLVRHELIGLRVKIVSGANKTCIGIDGRVVDETRNMLFIEKKNGKVVKVVKKDYIFLFTLPSGKHVKVNGELIVGRPEDRIKKRLKI